MLGMMAEEVQLPSATGEEAVVCLLEFTSIFALIQETFFFPSIQPLGLVLNPESERLSH